jgi:hypothetical protein
MAAFPLLPGMEFSWVDPVGTPNRRWRVRMSKELFEYVVNLKLFGGNPPPGERPMFGRRRGKPAAEKPADQKEKNKKRRRRRISQAKASKKPAS